jgi:hypothetical protein
LNHLEILVLNSAIGTMSLLIEMVFMDGLLKLIYVLA